MGVGVLVERDGAILLIRRQGTHGSGTWSTPGGHLDYGETPHDCAVREVREETGVEVTDVVFEGITNDLFAAEDRHYVTLWFRARWASGEPRVAAPDEMSAVGWFPRDTLPAPLFLSLHNLLEGRCLRPSTARPTT